MSFTHNFSPRPQSRSTRPLGRQFRPRCSNSKSACNRQTRAGTPNPQRTRRARRGGRSRSSSGSRKLSPRAPNQFHYHRHSPLTKETKISPKSHKIPLNPSKFSPNSHKFSTISPNFCTNWHKLTDPARGTSSRGDWGINRECTHSKRWQGAGLANGGETLWPWRRGAGPSMLEIGR